MHTVFISYSRKDALWKNQLRPHLEALSDLDINVWTDDCIQSSQKWRSEITAALDRARFAVLLISADFLASPFIKENEVPVLLRRREQEGLILIPVLIRACAWKRKLWVEEQQLFARGKPLAGMPKSKRDEAFAGIADFIAEKIESDPPKPVADPPSHSSPPLPAVSVDIDRLPETGLTLVGRRSELQMLDDAWADAATHVVSLVAAGGVGKSTLVRKWLARLEDEGWGGARLVFGWSFYSQGTGERVTAADAFIDTALRWFGDPNPEKGSAWDKGERLADLVAKEKTILVLDGLEPLQEAHPVDRGRIKDPALAMLIAGLARRNAGLCVITTRLPVADLEEFPDHSLSRDLEHLSPEAGAFLLRHLGVRGSYEEIEAAAEAFGHHALALTLLGRYLYDIPGHPAVAAQDIPDLPDTPETQGRHPRRVMAAFAARFGPSAELDWLHLLGLFDRPAPGSQIEAVLAPPPIPGLTEHLTAADGAAPAQRLIALETLRTLGLIAPRSKHAPNEVDAHPLVREQFGSALETTRTDAWWEGHSRLYEHLRDTTEPHQPDTLARLQPLYQAVAHGCAAGRHQNALDDVLNARIWRREEYFSIRKLGAVGADLAAVSGFFWHLWDRPVPTLTDADQSLVLSEAAFRLRALGRLADAVAPMRAGLDAHVNAEDWGNAAQAACNLSELLLILGDVRGAVAAAVQGVDYADRSGDAFQRESKRTTLADARHLAGEPEAAAVLFSKAERMQSERQLQFPYLYSLWGYRYCDLLLSRGQADAVIERAQQTLEWVSGAAWLLDIALDHLSLGLAWHAKRDQAQAAEHLDQAVAGLRAANQMDYLPRGLLARAAFWCDIGDHPKARADLEEALRIAKRGGMKLFLADIDLEYARLFFAEHDLPAARRHLETARAAVERMGYGRRRLAIAALDAQLAGRS